MTIDDMRTTFAKLSSETLTFHDTATIEKMSRLKSISSSTNGPCVACGKGATKCCVKRKGTPDGLGDHYVSTFYCTSGCQKADWPKHKSHCSIASERKILYRAASTVKQLFLINSLAAFDWGNIEKVEKRAAFEWHVHLKPKSPEIIVVPFPKKLISDIFDQEAILAWGACNSAVEVLGPVLERMLDGVHCKVEEILVEIKNRKLFILIRSGDEPQFKDFIAPFHRLFRVTLLKSGEEYAIDLSGSQYGHGEFISPWKQYMQLRVKRVMEVWDLGKTKAWLKDKYRAEIYAWKQNHADCLHGMTGLWCHRSRMSLGALMRLPDAEYSAMRGALLREVKEGTEYHTKGLLQSLSSICW